MPRQHITCQWNGQATRLIRIKCGGERDLEALRQALSAGLHHGQ
jgi:hypothetical protein